MNSQICDSTAEPNGVGNSFAEVDQRIAELEERRALIAERRRALAEPTHKLVVANPSGMHHKITLGAVLVNAGFQASDGDAIAGLLDAEAVDFIDRVRAAASERPTMTVAELVAHILVLDQRELTARGLFLTWRKRLALYLEDREEWLARDDELRLSGHWRDREMSADQRWLIRVTCRALRIAMPGHLRRGQAADWLEAHGANLNYGDFV